MLGGTYGASASVNYSPPLAGYMSATIAFSCAPENLDKMISAALDEVKKLREQGPSAEDIRKDQEVERRELEVSVKQNAYWTGSMQTIHMLGWDPVRISKRAERIELLTTENVRDTFRKYFPADRYTIVTLVPEVTAAVPAKTRN
jgi:zinc protease